jgi:hypothetical protein
MFVFLCEPLDRPEITKPSHALEVTDRGWFAEDDLPENLDPGHKFRIPEAFRVWRGEGSAFFDRGESDKGLK